MDVSLTTLLVRPKRAFDDGVAPPSFAQALALVIVLSGVSAATMFPVYVAHWDQASAVGATITLAMGGQRVALPAVFPTNIVRSLVQSVLLWLGAAATLHVLARASGGTGRFRAFAAYVGWSFAPYLVVYPLVAVVAGLLLATTPDATLRGVLYGAGTAAQGPVNWNGSGLMDTRSPLLTGALLWMGYLWTGALRVAHGLSVRVAVAVAGVVTATLLLVAHAPV
ncbi:YIP1 family protein [Halomicrobium katesii]|uniref:YIP1 family protein n=1 Tax=Halomicrobium katesii TaxID=437163 RepID=UPI00036343C0|nr:YIP1 family protein [Halomicrobium katesii]